ncbi:serine hydrolase [Tenacibaculum sp.]|nr:serine hydrolase [Tenacibaculum sp.]
MKINYLFLIILILFSSCNENIKPAINNLISTSDIVSLEQSELIFQNSKIFPNNTQFSISIIENGEIKFVGIKRENDTIIKTENHKNIFEIGSLTKIFTSTILSNFVIENIIDLDDKINDYIKIPLKNNVKISFKQLANHTSGLPKMPSNLEYSDKQNKFKDYKNLKLEQFLQNDLELSFTPGKQSSYSNIGVGILGYTLSEISKTNYQELLNKYIFSKYGMNNTSMNRKTLSKKLIKGLNTNGEETSNWDLASLTPAGGLLSSVEDLSKFAVAHFNPQNKDLILTQQKTFEINNNTEQGLGWRIENNSANKWHRHNGRTGGYTSSISLDIENKNGVIILSNISTIGNENKKYIINLCSELMKTLKTK